MLLKHKQKSSLRLNKNNKGVTLIEVIAVVAVLSVVMAAVMGFMITGAQMSAKVSGTAGDSMKEQTAVEFINKTILKHGRDDMIPYPRDGSPEEPENIEYGLWIKLEETNSAYTYAFLTTLNDTVVYQVYTSDKEDGESAEQTIETMNLINTIELCPGKINFENNIDNDTVIYYLNNGEKHVVHLRVVKTSAE